MGAPLISVIVPNYNHGAFLRERMGSILGQSITDLEVILLDDASMDDSVSILREFASHPLVRTLDVNERNSGSPFIQWRKGVEMARGTWIWIAESDDSCTPDLLERLLALNDREKDGLGLVFAQSQFVDDAGVRIGSMRMHTAAFQPDPFEQDLVMDGYAFVDRYLKVMNVIPNASGVLFRRSLVTEARTWEGMDRMRMCGDWLLWVRILVDTSVGFLSDELNAFRHHAATSRQLTSRELKQRRILEEAAVQSALVAYHGVDRSLKERSLYHAWFCYFSYRQLFSPRLLQVRFRGRSWLGFMSRFLAYQWQVMRDRKLPRKASSKGRP